MDDYIGGFFALVGVVIGGLITFLTNYVVIWREESSEARRVRKEMLFYLLELDNMFTKLKSFDTHFFPAMQTVFGELKLPWPSTEEEVIATKKLFRQLFETMAGSHIGLQIKDLEPGYNKALLQLAALDPSTAYKLQGKVAVSQIPNLFAAFSSAASKYVDEAGLQDLQRKAAPHFDSAMIKSLSDNIEELIIGIAKKTDRSTHREIKEMLESKNSPDALLDYLRRMLSDINLS